MEKLVSQYCRNIKKRFNAGISTEHSYRADLQRLLQELVKGITVTNEPKRQQCGAPDFIIQKKDIPVGYIEAKNIGIDLDKIEKSDQLKRYKGSLENLILTDYTEFRFIRNGSTEKKIKLADVQDGHFKSLPENFDSFITHITDFCSYRGYTIKSSENLARMMAKKARMMEDVIYQALINDSEDNTLKDQYEAFKRILIEDLTERYFADIYAQTIAYGLFAARLHDPTLEDFSREEALFLVPKSNPFLRQLFSYIAGPDLDSRIIWIVNDLADIFRGTDVNSLLADFGETTQQNDPFIHFYETFLAEYDAKLRKKRGVYYTPEPVVNFIVRAVDDILKTDFNLPQGLADTSKVELKVDEPGYHKKVKKQFHKVQILDPAAGTGTFLSEVVKQIYKRFENQKGIWSGYVEKELIPRLNGFEIMVASYTICHLKLELLLRETGYKPKDEDKQQRLRVFLTNSLEEPNEFTGSLFATWLSREAKEANIVKRDAPVMVVLGNPPYANFGQMNKGDWILRLLEDYKEGLNEKKINIDDDYIKFIRYGEHFITKNGEGILAYISNNSFIDGITHRKMRQQLLKNFNRIYVLDLHGNSNKKETAPDGSKDENVFDIQQGVSINFFVKTKARRRRRKQVGEVYNFNLFGTRNHKYEFLRTKGLSDLPWQKLKYEAPYFFFVPKDFGHQQSYRTGFSVAELFPTINSGIKTDRDSLFISEDSQLLSERIKFLLSNSYDETFKYNFNVKDSGSYKITQKIKNKKFNQNFIRPIQYRPFDYQYIYYDRTIISRPAEKTMKHFLPDKNVGLIMMRQYAYNVPDYCYVFISTDLVECRIFISNKGIALFAPLYLYTQTDNQITILGKQTRTPNLNYEIINQIADNLNLQFTTEEEDTEGTFAPIDILDYIYAVLHSPSYRETFKEFLKIDFPRIPYTKDQATFWNLVKLGSELRKIHLLESPVVDNFITSYPKEGDNVITRKIGKKDFELTDDEVQIGRIWINDEQYFDGIPVIAWEFYIGGYQPAQKWLKDRKGRELSFEDIQHYQRIIVALTETDRIMKKIDEIEFM